MKFDTVGVVGLGLMGRGIAASFLGAGLRVIVVDSRQQALTAASVYIESAIKEIEAHGNLQPDLPWSDRYHVAHSLTELADCAFVVESVPEDLAVKRAVFDELESIVGAGIPIASNTSALPITRLQQGRMHPSRFLGMHWAEPAYATRFLEIIRGNQTSDPVINAAVDLGRATGKEPCVVNQDIQGFIANRLAYAMYREAANLLDLGIADVETIDRAARNGLGLWATLCGPFRWIDITGGPALYAKVMAGLIPTLSAQPEVPAAFLERQEKDERGAINGRGFYTYEEGDLARWQTLLHQHAWEVLRLQEQYHPLSADSGERHPSKTPGV
jgi:3-hydroxybutyryl-CoA dehydrogenase